MQCEGLWHCSNPTVRVLSQIVDEILPTLAFLVYVMVEGAVIYGMLKWSGAL